MPTLDQFQAFVAAAEAGSFSAAARHLGKAQSAVSTAVSNLEIDVGLELFDRSRRNPVLTAEGAALIPYAQAALQGNHEFIARATSLSEGDKARLTIAVEEGVAFQPVHGILEELAVNAPMTEIELLEPGRNDVAELLKSGRADLGVMLQQEDHVEGLYYRGVGYACLVPVCSRGHPLAELDQVSHADLRRHRQLITRSRSLEDQSHLRERKSPTLWYCDSPYLMIDLVSLGLGWALLPQAVARKRMERGEIVRLHFSFQQSEILQGIDLVWTERHALGPTGAWLKDRLLSLKPEAWRG